MCLATATYNLVIINLSNINFFINSNFLLTLQSHVLGSENHLTITYSCRSAVLWADQWHSPAADQTSPGLQWTGYTQEGKMTSLLTPHNNLQNKNRT